MRVIAFLLFFSNCLVAFSATAEGWNVVARYLFTVAKNGHVMSVIDTSNNTKVGSVYTEYPIDELAVSAFGHYAYLGHAEQQSLSIIDLKTGRYEREFPLPMAPRHMTADTYAGLVITDSEKGGLARVDLGAQKLVFYNADIPPSRDVILSPSGTVGYWASGTTSEIGAISMVDGRVLWRVKIADGPVEILPLVRSLDGLYILAVIPQSGQLIAVHAGNGGLLMSKRFGGGLQRPYVTANGQYFLVPETSTRQLHMYSQVTLQLVESISLPSKTPLVTAGFFDIIGLGYGEKAAYAFDLLKPKDKPLVEIKLPVQASDVIVTSDSKHAYAALPGANAIAHISLSDGMVQLIEGLESPTIVEMGASNAVCH